MILYVVGIKWHEFNTNYGVSSHLLAGCKVWLHCHGYQFSCKGFSLGRQGSLALLVRYLTKVDRGVF